MANNASANSSANSSAAARVFGIAELQELIAEAVVQGADSPATAMTDIKNLRLTSKAWDNAIKESPTVQHLFFNEPIPEYRVRRLTKPENARDGQSLDNMLQLCNAYSERSLLSPSQVTFNPILQHLLLRFRAQLGSRPRGTDTVKIKLGSKSFWMAYSNSRADPHLHPEDEYTVEVDTWKKLGREVCGQYICQPPVQNLTVRYFSETDAFLYGYYKATTHIFCQDGIQVWHVLSGLLDFLVEGGAVELDELCYPSLVQVQEQETDGDDEVDGSQPAFDNEEEDEDDDEDAEDDEDDDDDDDNAVQIIIDGPVDPNTIPLVIQLDDDKDRPIWEDEAGDAAW